MSNDGTHTHKPCCSSHGIDMTCERYRSTHFVEVRPCCTDDQKILIGPLTASEWRRFQSTPDEGYSHRSWVDHKIAQRVKAEIEALDPRITHVRAVCATALGTKVAGAGEAEVAMAALAAVITRVLDGLEPTEQDAGNG